MPLPFADSLCHSCAAPPRYVRTAQSLFIRCPVVAEKYPRQPVVRCAEYTPAVIATERLVLRELTAADEPFVASMTDTVTDSADWMRRSFERYRRDGYSLWLAIERDGGRPVGQIGLLQQEIDGRCEPEVAYHLRADFRGQGFAVEGARAVIDWAFARGFDYVIALVRDDNVASQSVARKLGLTPGELVTHLGQPHRRWRIDRR